MEELRADLARFMANANLIYAMMDRSAPEVSELQALTAFREQFVSMFEASSRIRLKLDDTDAITAPILATMREIEDRLESVDPPSTAIGSCWSVGWWSSPGP